MADNNEVLKTASEGTSNKVAPGEFLPISVKLVNFGSQKRVDVAINYKIVDSSGNEFYSESETVAVDTTASFIKRIQIPYTLKPGLYTVITSLHYPYQERPAVSKFSFSVEKKIGGFFKDDLTFYTIVLIIIIAGVFTILYFFIGWGRNRRITFHDYSNKPKHEVIYYEMLSDIVAQMRMRIGDDALEIAKNIPDLEINPKTGLIIKIKKDPSKIIALLIFRYEKLTGRRMSFGLRQK